MHSPLSLLLLAPALVSAWQDSYVLHEKRASSDTWLKGDRLEKHSVVPVRVGLVQQNLEKGYDFVMDVADPDSPNYGKHWSAAEVIEMFSPSEEAVDAVMSWLNTTGIDLERVTHSDNRGWLAFDANTEEVENMLRAELHEYEHTAEGHISVGCDEYHVPEAIKHHIDYVTPGVKMSTTLKKRTLQKRNFGGRVNGAKFTHGSPHVKFSSDAVDSCATTITPACIRALYDVPKPSYPYSGPAASNKMGLFEDGDYYVQIALNQFYGNFTPYIPKGHHPILESVDGGVSPTTNISDFGFESILDITLMYPLIYPQQITLYQVDDAYWAAKSLADDKVGFLNTFLDALDGSYCTYKAFGEKGNAPSDPKYPDPRKNGYKGKLQCGTAPMSNVISVSYGSIEADHPENYLKRQCNEFMKLSLQGTSFLFSSGDYGVGSFLGCLNSNGVPSKKGKIFAPSMPLCPYITLVGATTIYPGQTVNTPESAAEYDLGSIFFASGGGFSNIFPTPNYQKAAVNNYLTKYKPPYKSYARLGAASVGKGPGLYNRIGRAYPDVAANGAKIGTCIPGNCTIHGYGTSASAPIFSSLINRIVQERIDIGKGPLGFLNAALYKNPQLLHDVVNGTNPGCGTKGFKTAPGWDPVTGLGTPNYPALLKYFKSLP